MVRPPATVPGKPASRRTMMLHRSRGGEHDRPQTVTDTTRGKQPGLWHREAEEPGTPLYGDPSQPIEKRVDDLLGRMTLEEKVGQMNMPCVYESGLGQTIPEKTEGVQKFAAGTLVEKFGPGGGFFTLAQHHPARRPPAAGRVPEPAPAAGPGARRAWAFRSWRPRKARTA